MKAKFTILTIVKNDKKGIIKTIRSVLDQNFKNFEYIVIDGNSTDGTFFQIKKIISNKNFKLIRRHDVSYYESLNYGIKLSSGEFVGVLNSGDIFVNKYVLERISRSINKNTRIFYSNLIFKNQKNIVRFWSHKISEITKFNLFKIPHTTLFIKKSLFRKIGFYNLSFKISSDIDFIIRMSKNFNKIKHLNFNSVCMEYGGLSTNIKNLGLKLKEDLSILMRHYKFLFIFFYFLKIYFKIGDYKLKNLIK